MKKFLDKLQNKENLNFEESKSVFEIIMSGQAKDEQIYNFLTLLSDKGESLGLLIAMDDKPIQENQYMEYKAIMEFFSLRCANEIVLDGYKQQKEFTQPLKKRLESSQKYKLLSKREFEVFEYLASGLSSKSIAKKISVTLPTVKFHLKNIYRKLDLKGRKGVLKLYAQTIQ